MEDTKEILNKPEDLISVTSPENKLAAASKNLVEKIIESDNKEDLQEQLNLFAMAQAKKGAIRVSRLNDLIEMIDQQALKRLQTRPDQLSNKELLDYMNIVSQQIEKISGSIENINEIKNEVKLLNQKNEVNINVGAELDKESKERVMDAVANLLKQACNIQEADIQNSDIVNNDFEDLTNRQEN